MKAYKLTDQNGQTRNSMQWGENVSHTAVGKSEKLCTDGWIHFYTDPLIAVLMNPAHADFDSPVMWECEISGEVMHEVLKSGCKTLKTTKQIPLPEVTLPQRIAFGILCAKEVCVNEAWNRWADRWLSGEDRTKESADAAREAAFAVSAWAAVDAVYAAVYAAGAAGAAGAAYAAGAAVYAAADAANAATANAANNKSIDFVKLAHEALECR